MITAEENVIRYVGGYVIASLKKKEGDEELLAGLYSFNEKEANDTAAIPASAAWVEEVDRGGLTKITEEAHQFFVALEGSVRSYVTIFGKIDHLRASIEIHFLPVHERYIHALFRNTKH